MSNKVNKFDHVLFGSLDVVMYEDTPHFIGNEVCGILGYSNNSETLKYHCKSLIKLDYSNMLLLGMEAKPTGVSIIPEKDVYRLIMRSKLPNAEVFQDWVMDEVLPAIRKTGGYVSDVDQIINTFYKNEAPHIKEVIRAGLNFQKNNQHKIDFCDDVSEVVNLKTMTEVAKAFGLGRNKMYAMLREMKILDQHNAPYQRFIGTGYFQVKQTTKNKLLLNMTMVTGKGEIWLHKQLLGEKVAA
jgi:anti-repressor protein